MIKGRLLGTVCALGLIVAAPAFAAGMDSSGTSGSGGMMMNGTSPGASDSTGQQHGATSDKDMRTGDSTRAGTDMHGSQGAMGDTNSMKGTHDQGMDSGHAGNMDMHRSQGAMNSDRSDHSHQAMGRDRRGPDTSQNTDVDRLNDQSLQAAKQGHPFMTGSANGTDQDHNSGSQPDKTRM